MKKILTYLISAIMLFGIFALSLSAAWFDANDILPTSGDWTIGAVWVESTTVDGKIVQWWTSQFDKILNFIKESIFWLLALIAIGMFLYVWFNLVKAEWNPEELKKAFMTLIHVIIWLFIVAASWAIITMISSFTI